MTDKDHYAPTELAPPSDIEARVNAWARSGNPALLWPSIDPRALEPAALEIERGVSLALAGEKTSLGAADGRDADAIGIASLPLGIGPLLGYWVESGILDVSTQLKEILARHLAHGRIRIERIRSGVTPAIRALVEAGINPAIIKGFHTAGVYFPEAGLRPIADVDVIVSPAKISRAEETLAAAGFTGDPETTLPYKRAWSPPNSDGRIWSLELWDHRSPWKIDLHDGINVWNLYRYNARLDPHSCFDGSWAGLGIPVRVATQPLLIAIHAAHLSGELYQMRLLRLVELTLMIRRDVENGDLDWRELEDLLARARALRFVYPAFALVESLAPGTMDPTFAARSRRASTNLSRYVVDRLTPSAPLLQDRVSIAERLMWVSRPIEMVQRIGSMAVPANTPDLPTALTTYHARVRRVFTGRVSWRMRAVAPPIRRADD